MTSQSSSVTLYGALAAAISISIFYKVNVNHERRKSNEKEDCLNSSSSNRSSTQQDTSLKHKGIIDSNDINDDDDWFEHIPPHMQREVLKDRRRKEKLAYLAMKSPMYDNVQMIDKNNVLIAKISKKKAQWYVNKGLADYCDNPMQEEKILVDGDDDHHYGNKVAETNNNGGKRRCIRINFTPSGNSNNTTYTTADKENICVKCGRGDYHLMRHHIVPSAYRSLLPKKYKSHMSHDITLLCGDCHLYCQQESQRRMKEIEDMCRPLGSKPKYTNDDRLYKVRSSALALLNWKHKIPENAIFMHQKRVLDYLNATCVDDNNDQIHNECSMDDCEVSNKNDYFDESKLTKEQLQELIDLDYRIENPEFVSGPELVVNSIMHDEDKIADFVKSWRGHFIETVHPRFLPDGWSVDHHVASRPR